MAEIGPKPTPIIYSEADIAKLLPHGDRFRFPVRAEISEPGEKGKAWLVDLTQPRFDYLQDHFPGGNQINPGVILVEAGAQTLGLVFASGRENPGNVMGLLVELDRVRLKDVVYPTDQVVIEAEVKRQKMGLVMGHVKVLKGAEEKLAAEGDISFFITDREKVLPTPKLEKPSQPVAANESQAQDIRDKTVVVFTIPETLVNFYQGLGRVLKFGIEVVAEEGEYYLKGKAVNTEGAAMMSHNVEDFRRRLIIEPVVSEAPVGRGRVAISVQKPPSEADHTRFHQVVAKVLK
jgi:3-hydroxymyristoyl/3-hydroxydecanoyl-(acyl carrier protein) dehydratase